MRYKDRIMLDNFLLYPTPIPLQTHRDQEDADQVELETEECVHAHENTY